MRFLYTVWEIRFGPVGCLRGACFHMLLFDLFCIRYLALFLFLDKWLFTAWERYMYAAMERIFHDPRRLHKFWMIRVASKHADSVPFNASRPWSATSRWSVIRRCSHIAELHAISNTINLQTSYHLSKHGHCPITLIVHHRVEASSICSASKPRRQHCPLPQNKLLCTHKNLLLRTRHCTYIMYTWYTAKTLGYQSLPQTQIHITDTDT